jgi:phosphoglycolate phosphatase
MEKEVGLVGPPLDVIMGKILGAKHSHLQVKVINSFKRIYDNGVYKNTCAYEGIEALLQSLKRANINLYIATNKRIEPTRKIIENLGWDVYFTAIYGINSCATLGGQFTNKADMISELMSDCNIVPKDTIYVGDRHEDQVASELNGLDSITVGWGYGEYSNLSNYKNYIKHPSELLLIAINYV